MNVTVHDVKTYDHSVWITVANTFQASFSDSACSRRFLAKVRAMQNDKIQIMTEELNCKAGDRLFADYIVLQVQSDDLLASAVAVARHIKTIVEQIEQKRDSVSDQELRHHLNAILNPK